jgi:hypothetical protein
MLDPARYATEQNFACALTTFAGEGSKTPLWDFRLRCYWSPIPLLQSEPFYWNCNFYRSCCPHVRTDRPGLHLTKFCDGGTRGLIQERENSMY